MAVTRRQIFAGGAVLGAAWVSLQLAGHRPLASLDSPMLGSAGRRTLLAASEALLPSPDDAAWAAGAVDDFLATGDPIQGEALRLALSVLEHWPGGLRFSRFSRLTPEQRRQVLQDWCRSPIGPKRQIAVAVTKTVLFTHYARPESWVGIGYPGPMVTG